MSIGSTIRQSAGCHCTQSPSCSSYILRLASQADQRTPPRIELLRRGQGHREQGVWRAEDLESGIYSNLSASLHTSMLHCSRAHTSCIPGKTRRSPKGIASESGRLCAGSRTDLDGPALQANVRRRPLCAQAARQPRELRWASHDCLDAEPIAG